MPINVSHWVIQTFAMMLTAFLIPKLRVSGPIPALATVVTLGFINAHYWSAALFFSLPADVTSNAIFLFLANGVLFWIVVKVLPGIEVEGVLPALAAPVVFTVISVLLNENLKDVDWNVVWQEVTGFVQAVRGRFLESAPSVPKP